MKSGVLWHEVVTAVHKREYPDVKLEHMLADAGGMQLVRAPEAVRRDRHRQPLRRHAVRRRGDADRLARHAAVGLARRARRRRPASARRSTSRCTARRPTSPARASPTRSPCSPPSPWRSAIPSASSARPTGSSRRSPPSSTAGYAPPTSGAEGKEKVGTTAMGDAILAELDRLATGARDRRIAGDASTTIRIRRSLEHLDDHPRRGDHLRLLRARATASAPAPAAIDRACSACSSSAAASTASSGRGPTRATRSRPSTSTRRRPRRRSRCGGRSGR